MTQCKVRYFTSLSSNQLIMRFFILYYLFFVKYFTNIYVRGGISMPKKEFIDIMKSRTSIRKFTDEQLEKDDLIKIADAGRYSPTAMNKQTRKFTIVQNASMITELARAIDREINQGDYNFYNPNAIILISVPKKNSNGQVETGLAAQNMWLQATALDIGMVWTNQIRNLSDEPEVRTVLDSLDIPKNHVCWCVLAVGIPDETPEVKEQNEPIHYID